MNQSIELERARFVTQTGGLKYDFEFKVGEDVLNTFPTYLSSFMDIEIINNYNEMKGLCFVMEPKVSSSLFVYTGLSAAPRYELSIAMEIPIMKDGILHNRLYVKNNSEVIIAAFDNEDDVRTETMRIAYEEQLNDLFNDLEEKIREYIGSIFNDTAEIM